MPSLTSQLKSLTDEELTRIRLQLILKMVEIDPKLKRLLELYLIRDEAPKDRILTRL